MIQKPAIEIVCCVLLLTSPLAWCSPRWVGSWGAAPQPPTQAAGPFPATPVFDGQTIRQTVRLSAGGERIRLRLTNEYGAQPLGIGAARIAVVDGSGLTRQGTERVVSFHGRAAAIIPAGAPLLSDAIDLTVRDLDSLAISLYVPHDSEPCTCHPTGMQDALVSGPGDFTAETFEPTATLQVRAFLSGVEVWAPRASTVVVLGDSISDGVGSTSNANHRWPDLLAERLSARKSRDRWAVVNMGISGNRMLSDGAGESALARFDRDVLAVPGATHVIVFLGVNDIGLAFGKFEGEFAELVKLLPMGAEVTGETMIAAYRQLIVRAHSEGLKIYGATIAPYEGAGYYSADGEAVRQAVNEWIRQGGEFDAVLDFDAVVRDANQPSRFADGLHSGDFLHGNDAGYRAIAASIDLSLFQ